MKSPVRSDRSPHVALLVETSLGSGRDILRGIARYMRRNEHWAIFHTPGSLSAEIPSWLRRWRGDGIIARVAAPEMAAILQSTQLPVVDVLASAPDAGFPTVHVNDAAIARLAFEHFVARGFRRFAYVGLSRAPDPGMHDWAERRRDAFRLEAHALGAEISIYELRREVPPSWEKQQDRLAAWLRGLPKPIGLMVCSDQRGIDVLEACHRAEVRVPEQIAVVGVDNDRPLCDVCTPALSSVWPDHFAVGYQAAAALSRLMRGRPPLANTQLVPPRGLVTRQSSDVFAVDDPLLISALQIIRERACSGIGVEDVAREVGASRSVLQRRFRLQLGRTVHDHLVASRLKRAIELICGTDLSLLEIAERSGFNHQEYMGVVFRERLGQTPAEYRKSRRP